MPDTKYPNITVKLVGEDGNVFAILSRVRNAMQRARVPRLEIVEFTKEAMSDNFDNLLATVLKWVNTE